MILHPVCDFERAELSDSPVVSLYLTRERASARQEAVYKATVMSARGESDDAQWLSDLLDSSLK